MDSRGCLSFHLKQGGLPREVVIFFGNNYNATFTLAHARGVGGGVSSYSSYKTEGIMIDSANSDSLSRDKTT
jgi:hypothetical protein